MVRGKVFSSPTEWHHVEGVHVAHGQGRVDSSNGADTGLQVDGKAKDLNFSGKQGILVGSESATARSPGESKIIEAKL